MALTLGKENFLEGEIARTINTARIQKGLYGGLLIEKAEGSRGGKVIGHTKSGKPIYVQRNASKEAKFSHQDHTDAAYSHLDESTKHSKEGRKSLAEHHNNEFDRHMASSKHKKANDDVKKSADEKEEKI